MAWTSSAFPRGIRVSEALTVPARTTALNALLLLEKSSLSRRILLAGAAYLALLGLTLPLVPRMLLPPLLLALSVAFMIAVVADDEEAGPVRRAPLRDARSAPAPAAFTLPERMGAPARARDSAIVLPEPPEVAPPAPPATARPGHAGLDRALAADLMPRISHEIRTPLNAIIGFADLMAKEVFGPLGHPRYREYLGHIRDSSRDLLKSSEDTLALTQLIVDPATPEEDIKSDLAHLAREAWASIAAAAAEKDVTPGITIPKGIDVCGERRALRQSLANIMASALDCAQPGSIIDVGAEPGPDRVRIEIKLAANAMSADACHETLGLAIARTLLDLQGTTLVHMAHPLLGWRATTWFDVAVQPDFFPAFATGGRSAAASLPAGHAGMGAVAASA